MHASGQAPGHQQRSAAERSRLLLEINNAIASHLELAPLLKAISECLRRELPHDFAGLASYDPEIQQLRVHGLNFEAGQEHFFDRADCAHRGDTRWTGIHFAPSCAAASPGLE